ncbi:MULTISPECIES: iron-sulfur cluster biosynthesis family protein [Brevibacillus]|jgi:iron-sulfur cluster assembly protein|uniref:Iron-sulfur cluster biosynthesis family protein n=1 Tax=Brevibacillus thermoruber TaxID=33942 RepID=A0A9X3TRE1_9BACL|nr:MULTISPECIES: iron-sulfur cluster biosynthesis family protein [Brevibacillus]MDA5109093.1 iron-sulfur cluster biosynthesis family protein [Brevibacillus thermoruber]TRY25274.1 iron-sulfur cluster biosynthesis family protein [Brevibacillus sp. LEMMJ03]
MSIHVTIEPAFAQAYQRYAGFRPGDTLRLYVRTGGPGTGGLFYAIEKDEVQPGDAVFEVEGMRFVIRPNDFWYFDGAELRYNALYGEYGFTFHNPRLDA